MSVSVNQPSTLVRPDSQKTPAMLKRQASAIRSCEISRSSRARSAASDHEAPLRARDEDVDRVFMTASP